MSRRQTQLAAHLVDRVFPAVRLRQWVLSVPFWLRWRMAFDHDLCLAVHREMMTVVHGFYLARGREAGHMAGETGGVTVIQRFGSACELNVHFHSLLLDGVVVLSDAPDDDTLRFRSVRPPSDDELRALCTDIEQRVRRLLVSRGLWEDDDEGGQPLALDGDPEPLGDLFAASVRQRKGTGPHVGARVTRLRRAAPRASSGRHKARVSGFDLHAGVTVGKKRRDRREELCRYLLRPPLAADRLSWAGDGDVLLRLKTPWSDGTSHLKLTPVELLGRLAALIPKPHKNQVLYTGVLSARHRWRDRVIPAAPDGDDPGRSVGSTSDRPNPDWATLMARGLGLDVLACPVCDGRLRHLANIMERQVIQRILRHLGLRASPPELTPAPQLELAVDWGA